MTQDQIRTIEKAEDMLTRLYFQLQDDPHSKKAAQRLDTILGKLYSLKQV